ncbi:uncharacterized protein FOMMEDRAFT_164971 [Fomitiporia mediterranea MF3/22]|uniref:uncharacterized protein n=1 Tax=Fomitiporia mediterranea (strain MF3/22) TaxID=694068 RepID=UPI0004407C79|nr:uncharacterized protein FOMMEDRAFT_164971 [Fomitiporia mediterranea MF3/22]EJD08330.1 hypothetical protein FOMMEDRAFT_164971 [Fomitiporia mediterranea MF3/22]
MLCTTWLCVRSHSGRWSSVFHESMREMRLRESSLSPNCPIINGNVLLLNGATINATCNRCVNVRIQFIVPDRMAALTEYSSTFTRLKSVKYGNGALLEIFQTYHILQNIRLRCDPVAGKSEKLDYKAGKAPQSV